MPRRTQFAKVIRRRQTRRLLMGPHTYVPRGARTQCAQNPSFPRLLHASSTALHAWSEFSPTLSCTPGQQGRSNQTSACHASESFAGAASTASTHVLETQRVPSVARSRNERAMECCFESEQTSWFGPTNAAFMPTPECGAGGVSSGECLPKRNKK